LFCPELFPDDEELNYKGLEIKNGTEAMTAFPMMAKMADDVKARARRALLEYCKLDTYAMVKILEKLKAV
jgi:hypothetical protein